LFQLRVALDSPRSTWHDAYSLWAFGCLLNVVLDSLPLLKGPVALSGYPGEVHEDLTAFILNDEPIAFASVKPLHLAGMAYCSTLIHTTHRTKGWLHDFLPGLRHPALLVYGENERRAALHTFQHLVGKWHGFRFFLMGSSPTVLGGAEKQPGARF